MRKIRFGLLIKIAGIVFLAFAIVLSNEIRLGIDRYTKNTLETDAEATIRNLDKFSKSYIESYMINSVDFDSQKFQDMYQTALSDDFTKIKCLTDAKGNIIDITREGVESPVIGLFVEDFMGIHASVGYFDIGSLADNELGQLQNILLDSYDETVNMSMEFEVNSNVEEGIFDDLNIVSMVVNNQTITSHKTSKKTITVEGTVTSFSSYEMEIVLPNASDIAALRSSLSSGQENLIVFNYKDAMEAVEQKITDDFDKFIQSAQLLTSTNYMDYYLMKPYLYHGKQYSTVMMRLYDWNMLSQEDVTSDMSSEMVMKKVTVGYIFVTQEYHNLLVTTFKQFMLDNASTYLLALLLIACICLAMAYIIIKPIRRIEMTAKHIARKEFDYPIDTSRHDEIGDLATSIDRMSKELEKTINNLHQEIERVQKLESLRKEFVSNFTHEIKTPLGIINGFSELVELEKDEKKRNEYIQVIQSETKRINELVLAMLDLSKLESQNIALQKKEIDLLDIVDECLDSMAYLFEKKNIELVTSLDIADVEADQFKMEMVITNFISNALRYTEQGHKVYVTLDENRFSVENEGAQIPEEDLEKVWLTFHKVDKSRNDEGTGLGLAICKAILELHNFKYGVENTEKGVLFYFEF